MSVLLVCSGGTVGGKSPTVGTAEKVDMGVWEKETLGDPSAYILGKAIIRVLFALTKRGMIFPKEASRGRGQISASGHVARHYKAITAKLKCNLDLSDGSLSPYSFR